MPAPTNSTAIASGATQPGSPSEAEPPVSAGLPELTSPLGPAPSVRSGPWPVPGPPPFDGVGSWCFPSPPSARWPEAGPARGDERAPGSPGADEDDADDAGEGA